jgi:predicted DCC family thiol-disulfide oxidoreductase YuxK
MGDNYEIEVFYDGGCPLCLREINLLRRWDREQKIRFTDIDAADFSEIDAGKSYAELMEKIQGRLPDGRWLEGVEVFRRLYAAVGFRSLVALSRWPVLSHLLDFGYRWFAKHRLTLTGRCRNGACELKRSPAA